MNNAQEILASRIQRMSYLSFGEEEKPIKPVALVEVIEEEKPAEKYEPYIPPRIITEEELKAARDEGYQQGHKDGVVAAEDKIDKEAMKREEGVKSLLETIANRITLAAEDQGNFKKSKQEMLSNLTMSIARKVAGKAMKSEPHAMVESLLGECLTLVLGETKIAITVPENLSEGLKEKMDALRVLLPGFTGELVVEVDSKMDENNCRVEWKNGYAERDTAKLWNDIETIITKMGT